MKAVICKKQNSGLYCVFPSSFIRLTDYLILNTMHVLAVKSVTTLLNYLTEKLRKTPPPEIIQKWNSEEVPEVVEKKVILI